MCLTKVCELLPWHMQKLGIVDFIISLVKLQHKWSSCDNSCHTKRVQLSFAKAINIVMSFSVPMLVFVGHHESLATKTCAHHHLDVSQMLLIQTLIQICCQTA